MGRHFIVFAMIFTVGFGCKFLKSDETVETIKETKTTTEITKERLKERLGEKGIKIASAAPTDKPNPLTLQVRFSTGNNNFLLNAENYDNFSALANTLREAFRMREENGVFVEGTNDIYKKITLPAYQTFIDDYNAKGIFVEDFEKLVDDLRNEGFDQIELDTDERNFLSVPVDRSQRRNHEDLLINPAKNEKTDSIATRSSDAKTISGGVINGKALNLPKPIYPAAAKAVRASGAVNVRVTVDENGNVVSAEAVTGHPSLRASAIAAAREAKFKPAILSDKPVKVEGIIVYNFTPD